MVRERVADNVFVFTSERYAQVNAGAVVGPDWSVVIDTLPFPDETLEIRDFVEEKLGSPVRYVVLTHYHADHVLGAYWFPNARVVAHSLCRQLLETRGRVRLEEARELTRELEQVELVLPEVVFESGSLAFRVGKRTLQLIPLPGHSPDGIGALVVEDHVLFAGDAMMPLPYLVDGDYEAAIASLKRIPRLKLENLVQGHGEVILRGEIQNAVRANLHYLANLRRHAHKAAHRRDGEAYLAGIDVEECGKSRILLGGLAEELHRRNLVALYRQLRA
ncbi:MAG: MBL fold metallo-hydrolase [Chloroflexota bacterium]